MEHTLCANKKELERIPVKRRRVKGRGFELSVGQELCIPFHKTVKESSKPFVSIVQTKSKTASCLPPYNTVTMESYYVCVFEDFKWK